MWGNDENDLFDDNNPYDQSIQPQSAGLPADANKWQSPDHIDFDNTFGANTDSVDDDFVEAGFDDLDKSPEISSPPARERFPNEDGVMSEVDEVIPKKGGYESRVEQYLYEHPSVPITISKAGRNPEGNGTYIVYTIKVKEIECQRRYSEFLSLREALVNLHPTLIIPPIPEKHRMSDYMIKMSKAKDDVEIIDHRRRMLPVFLNRCQRMREVRENGVWWKFFDLNASWSGIKNSPPISSIPKNILQAPPLDVSNPTRAHGFLPTPQTTKMRPPSGGHSLGTPPATRFPPTSENLSEAELDPYFISFEKSSRSLEDLLQGPMERTNQELIGRYRSLAVDLNELGARYNAFSISESSVSLTRAIEKVGQAIDGTYLNTSDLEGSLNQTYAEPMRENAQFAGIVSNVLRYRTLKRLQQEMTREELEKKRVQLVALEQSEAEAQRIEAETQRIEKYLNQAAAVAAAAPQPRHSFYADSNRSRSRSRHGDGATEEADRDNDTNSIDSDFPPAREPPASAPPTTSTIPGVPPFSPSSKSTTGKLAIGRTVQTGIGRLNRALMGIVDSDPERNRRDQISKTGEAISNLEMALGVAETDVKQASEGVLKDLRRFQAEKEADLKCYMIAFARCQVEWAKRNKSAWEEAKTAIDQIKWTQTSGSL